MHDEIVDVDATIDIHQTGVALLMHALGEARMWLGGSEDPTRALGVRAAGVEAARSAVRAPYWYDEEEDVAWCCYHNGSGDTSRWSTPRPDGSRLLVCFDHESGHSPHGEERGRVADGVLDVLERDEYRLVMRSDDFRRMGQRMTAPSVTSAFRVLPDGRVRTGAASLAHEGNDRPGPLPRLDDEVWQDARAERALVRDALLTHALPPVEAFAACLGSTRDALATAHDASALALRLGLVA